MFLYETHLHTSPVSACAVTKPEDYIDIYKKAGYSGICVTNHFFNGNSGIDYSLPWDERVRQYYDGYERMKKAAEGKDFDVFFGIEFNYEGDEFLLYGLEKEWVISHPEFLSYTYQELWDKMNELGILMVQAHPFRLRSYINGIRLHPEFSHAVEVYNSGNLPEENDKALAYAKEHNFVMTSGSDMHDVNNLIDYLSGGEYVPGGIYFETRPKDVKDFIRMVKNGECKIR